MAAQEEYKVKLEVFEGPLDLLLYLIRKDEVDIYDIPIETITSQYMQYLDLMRMLDLNIAGEFLVMAATLMMIKSRMLLPVEERTAVEDDGEEDVDPRWDLVRQLVEYKKFKDAAYFLERLEVERADAFVREGEVRKLAPDADLALQDVNIFDLISAFNQALKSVPQEELQEIFSERYTVGEKVDQLLALTAEGGEVSLSELLTGMRSRHEIVVTFLAVLELVRLRQLTARQAGQFGEIRIVRVTGA